MNVFDLQAVLSLDSSQYESGLNRASKSANSFANRAEGTTSRAAQGFTVLKGVVSNLVSTGINVLANAITSNLGGAISRLDILNNYEIVMGNLGHDSDVARAQIDKLSEAVNGLPTTLPSIVSVQQQFAALGGKMEDATDLTVALNNATLAGGQGQEKANSAMQQWYQMIAAGKSDMMSMRIINEAMPAQMDAISKSVLGEKATWQDLNKEWQKNPDITEKVKSAILDLNENGYEVAGKKVKAFKDQAIDANKGIQTSLTNIKTQVQIGLSNLIDNALGYKNVAETIEGFKEAVKAGFKGLNSFVDDVQAFGIGEALERAIFSARVKVWEAFSKLMDINWSSVFSKALSNLGKVFGSALKVALDFHTLKTDISKRMMEVGADMITGLIEGIIDAGPEVVKCAIDVMANFATGFYNNLNSLAETAVRIINQFVNYLSNNSDKVAEGAVKIVVALANGIAKNAPKVLGSIARLGATIVKGVIKIVPKLPPLAIRLVVALAKAIIKNAPKIASAAVRLASGLIKGIRSGISGIASAGGNLVSGFWRGIANKAGWLKGMIKGWVGNVKSWLKNLFGINSPSKWARDVIGKGIDEGMALGIEQNTGLVDEAMEDLIPSVSTDRYSVVKGITNGNKIITPTYNNYITVDGAEDPQAWAENFFGTLEMKARMA